MRVCDVLFACGSRRRVGAVHARTVGRAGAPVGGRWRVGRHSYAASAHRDGQLAVGRRRGTGRQLLPRFLASLFLSLQSLSADSQLIVSVCMGARVRAGGKFVVHVQVPSGPLQIRVLTPMCHAAVTTSGEVALIDGARPSRRCVVVPSDVCALARFRQPQHRCGCVCVA
jgi:hypothetical protein